MDLVSQANPRLPHQPLHCWHRTLDDARRAALVWHVHGLALGCRPSARVDVTQVGQPTSSLKHITDEAVLSSTGDESRTPAIVVRTGFVNAVLVGAGLAEREPSSLAQANLLDFRCRSVIQIGEVHGLDVV